MGALKQREMKEYNSAGILKTGLPYCDTGFLNYADSSPIYDRLKY
jgi:hypothetical protein